MTPRHSFDKNNTNSCSNCVPQKRLLDTVLTKQHKFMLQLPQKQLLDTVLTKTTQSHVENA